MAESLAATNALAPYANVRILLFSNQLPGVLDSPRTGRFVFEGFIKRLRQISSKDNSPGVDSGDFTYEGYLTRGAVLPLNAAQPWDWLERSIAWSTAGTRPTGPSIPALLGERIQAALKPNISQRPSDWLPISSWLFIPRRRAAANAADGSFVMPQSFYTPETLAAYLGVSTSTIYSWNTTG